MRTIFQLPPHEAHKIAAGEVVERPLNIVKELVENSLDAGARAITIFIEEGGKKLVRVEDDGCGMSAEDASMAFAHHATSKIKTVDDLAVIGTFGFRGEALSSIASIARVTLVSATDAALPGIELMIEAGTVIAQREVAAPRGSTITVVDPFFTMPARKKFLKSTETEWRAIAHLVSAMVLDYPHVHWKLFHDGVMVYNCPAVIEESRSLDGARSYVIHQAQGIVARVTQLHDVRFAQQLISCSAEDSEYGFTLAGAIGKPSLTRYDRSGLWVFVNRRWIKPNKLGSAILKGYAGMLAQGKFPVAYLFCAVDPDRVDINIHPRKEEVHLLHAKRIEAAITHMVQSALEKTLTPFFSANGLHSATIPHSSHERPLEASRMNVQASPAHYAPFSVQPKNVGAVPSYARQDFAVHEYEQQAAILPALEQQHYTILGQHDATYLVVSHADGLQLVDIHAAHERILYEKFAERFADPQPVPLLFPATFTLGQDECAMMPDIISLFQKYGVLLAVQEQVVHVHALPVMLTRVNVEEMVRTVLSWMFQSESADHAMMLFLLHEKLRAQMACKAAVKAGDQLSAREQQDLLRDLYACSNNLTCPHGRPTRVHFSGNDLEHMFKRCG